MRTYDLVLVMRPDLKDADRKKLLDTVKSWLGEVKVEKEDSWGQKALSYAIKNERLGFYEKFSLATEASIPQGFEKRILATIRFYDIYWSEQNKL